MAIIWQSSLVPFIDPNGAPYSGAKVYFFNASTTTPRTVYRDSGLGESHDHPVVANSAGRFPAIFLPPGDYRQRVTDALGVVIDDTDGISTPIFTDSGGGGGGDTPVELLFRTGMYADAHQTGSLSGWVRAAGRSIGAAASGATERANADCEALFTLLWNDTTLAVSGGRGANSASDWAAAKTITLPDLRQRARIGMASMGNSAASLIAAATFDGGENGDTLGATVGAGTVTLTEAQMPAHDHALTMNAVAPHTHGYTDRLVGGSGSGEVASGSNFARNTSALSTDSGGGHTPSGTIGSKGGGAAHANVQPSAAITVYIKL